MPLCTESRQKTVDSTARGHHIQTQMDLHSVVCFVTFMVKIHVQIQNIVSILDWWQNQRNHLGCEATVAMVLPRMDLYFSWRHQGQRKMRIVSFNGKVYTIGRKDDFIIGNV